MMTSKYLEESRVCFYLGRLVKHNFNIVIVVEKDMNTVTDCRQMCDAAW